MMTISGTAIGLDMNHGRGRPVDQAHQPAELGQAGPGIVPGGAQQQVIGLIFAEHVIDEVGREADLAPGLAFAGVLALDQPADHGNFAEGAFQEVAALDPFDELTLEDVG
jgi:hypothetical protein